LFKNLNILYLKTFSGNYVHDFKFYNSSIRSIIKAYYTKFKPLNINLLCHSSSFTKS